MKHLVFNAHRGNSLVSKLIRLLSHGIYNHISMEVDGFVYEAHIKSGVVKTSKEDWDDSTVSATESIEMSIENYAEVFSFLEEQVGKDYDVRGIFAFLFIFASPKMGYWYCSELSKIALAKAVGFKSLADAYSQVESPHSFWINLLIIKQAMSCNIK